jgi:glycosyltransferase involved in cell wall biosynthesis
LKKKVFLFVNIDWYLYSHRFELAKELSKRYDLKIFTKLTEPKRLSNMYDFDFNRDSFHPIRELGIFLKFGWVLFKEKPSIIHLVSIKPLLYGNIWARILNIKAITSVSGLGTIMDTNNFSVLSKTTRIMAMWSINGKNKKAFIFQNHQDEQQFIDTLNPRNYEITTTKGSGISLHDFIFNAPVDKDKIRIVFNSRLLKEKGLSEFYEAALILKDKWMNSCEFLVYGRIDKANPNAFTEEEILKFEIPGYFKYCGFSSDIKTQLIESDVVVLPSYYREGIPKSIIEACAIGRPIVTTNAIGCRECVDEGINGFKVHIKDSQALAEAIDRLLSNPGLREQMGKASRAKAEREFDVEQVIQKHFVIYKSMLQ